MTVESTLEPFPSMVTEIADLTRAGTEPRRLEIGEYYVVQGGDGTIREIDLTGDHYRDNPRQLDAAVALTHVDSLLTYWDKHNDTDSDMFADRDRRTITAIIDAHQGKEQEPDYRARWQSHRATLTLTHSDPLKAWLARDNKLDTQVGFAEFIEEWMGYIKTPDAADLLEMAQSFQATTKASFKSGFKLVNGQRQLEYTEEVNATVKGDAIAVPQTMTLRLPIWRGASTSEEFLARIRYRVNHGGPGQLGIGFKLDRPTDIIDAAFEAEVGLVEQHIGRPVLRGAPAGN